MWVRWDAQWFLHLAAAGYQGVTDYAFFPLYPFLIWLVTPMVGSGALAGLLISNLAFLGSLFWLHRLVKDEWGDDVAKRCLTYIILFPLSFYFSAVYSESLFLLFAVTGIALARRRIWLLAGMAGLGAALTRSVGFLLLIPLAYEYWRSREDWKGGWRVGIPLLGPVVFSIYQYFNSGNPLLFLQAQKIGWGRETTWPWEGFLAAIKRLLVTPYPAYSNVITTFDLAASLLFLVLIIWMIPRFPPIYSLYAGLLYLASVIAPSLTSVSPLMSMSRLVLVLFPGFVVLGLWGRREGSDLFITVTSAIIQGLAFAVFTSWHWLA